MSTIYEYSHLVGKDFVDPKRGAENKNLHVAAIERGAVDYVHVCKQEHVDKWRELGWSMWGPYVEALVLLHDLYLAASTLCDNAAEANEHVHPVDDYVYEDFSQLRRVVDNCEAWSLGGEFEIVVDQYGDRVPDKLLSMPDKDKAYQLIDCGLYENVVLNNMDWYERPDTYEIVVPAVQVPPGYLDFFDEVDDVPPGVLYITTNLRRFNELDGFYHA